MYYILINFFFQRLYDLIIRVEATDRDCTAKFGDICKYEILTTDQPFEIDNDGKC